MALLCPEEMHGQGKEEMEEEEAWPSSLPDLGRRLIQAPPVVPTLDNEMGKVPGSKGPARSLVHLSSWKLREACAEMALRTMILLVRSHTLLLIPLCPTFIFLCISVMEGGIFGSQGQY